jgi:hypothetical protein
MEKRFLKRAETPWGRHGGWTPTNEASLGGAHCSCIDNAFPLFVTKSQRFLL